MFKAHCKLKHSTKFHSFFRCRQKLSTKLSTKMLCCRTFNDIYSFFKHLSKTYLEINIKDNIKINNKTFCNDNNVLDIDKSFMEEITFSNLPSQSMPSTSCVISNSGNNFKDVTVVEFTEKIAQISSLFIANLYFRPSLPRKLYQEIIKSIKNFLNCIKIIEEKYKSIEQNPNEDLSITFDILSNAFADHSSEYQTMLYFKSLNFLIVPQEICIGAFIDSKLMNTAKQMLVKNRKIYIVPFAKMLKTFLELPDVYNKIMSNIIKSEQNKITSILQNKIWHSIKQQYNNDLLSLILYYDELEINNPLGTHRGLHKLGVYCTIGGIEEQQYASMLENIFLI